MPLSNILKSAAGTCPLCHQKAGILSCEHSQCRRTHDAGFQEMGNVAAEAARDHSFNEKGLRLTLAEIARHVPTGTATSSTKPSRRAGNGLSLTPWPTGSSPRTRRQRSENSGTLWPWETPEPPQGNPTARQSVTGEVNPQCPAHGLAIDYPDTHLNGIAEPWRD